MKDILAGLDESFFDAVPSPNSSPVKKQKHAAIAVHATPSKPKRAQPMSSPPPSSLDVKSESSDSFKDLDVSQTETLVGSSSANSSMVDCDITMLLEGLEDCDWDDMHDFLSPKKSSPKMVCLQPL